MNISLIEAHLYLSGAAVAENLQLLEELDIKYVLSVFDDVLHPMSESITYKKIDAEDIGFQDMLTFIPECNQFISNAQTNGQNVLVHCHAGISRSATIVIAFMMNKYQISYESALEMVRNQRSVYPNQGFVEQLRLYEEMGFTLNANHRRLRQHLLKTNLNVEFLCTPEQHMNRLQHYFNARDMAEGMTESLNLGKNCLCVKCNQHLFNEIHVLDNLGKLAEGTDPTKECEYTYIEPQKWMSELLKPFDLKSESVIKCPKCGEVVIEYNKQFRQYQCECRRHSGLTGRCLRFRIATAKFKIKSKD